MEKTVFKGAILFLFIGIVLTFLGYINNGLDDYNLSSKAQTSRHLVNQDLSFFENIDLNCNISDITIKTSPQKKASITYYQDKNYPLTIKMENKTLYVDEKAKLSQNSLNVKFLTLQDLSHLNQNLHFGIETGYSILITLPKDTQVKQLKAKLKAGQLSLENNKVEHLDVNLSAGDIDIDNTSIDKGNLQLLAGNLNFLDSKINNSKIKLSTGDFELENSRVQDSQLILNTGDFTSREAVFLGKNSIFNKIGSTDIYLKSYDLSLSSKKI
ncbi:DUF4097 domain-containing protein [Streptococcus didelphis]|uniref:DUF4097 family beta strand repeat-containing protein n=1 Tax=Streptococcus didelphis TaxID=102886 RepID=UPI0027D1F8EA|nr:DUF4097 family beta strand repeat-containing protein [Streptococcus didelphis]WMB29885.1 DUF4097 domain-containing protein [Streptococcus didelphis]